MAKFATGSKSTWSGFRIVSWFSAIKRYLETFASFPFFLTAIFLKEGKKGICTLN